MSSKNKAQRKIRIYWGLYPLSLLYGGIVFLRNKFFDWGWLRSQIFPMPVISIGNISVGGTGKTPHTEYLIRLLKRNYRVAVLSRGYRRKTKGFVLSTPLSTIEEIGDEPYQMAHKFKGVRVAVDADRCHGIQKLTKLANDTAPEVVLLDDAYQHRYVKPGLSILLIDYNRPITSDCMLPAGRLREPVKGKERANIIVFTKCPENISKEEEKELVKDIAPLTTQSVFFTTFRYCHLQALFDAKNKTSLRLDSLTENTGILLVTGIASPKAIIRELKKHTHHVQEKTFTDHHDFSLRDIHDIETAFSQMPEKGKLLITTEKDAARLIHNPAISESIKPYIYVLPIEVTFTHESGKVFDSKVIDYINQGVTH